MSSSVRQYHILSMIYYLLLCHVLGIGSLDTMPCVMLDVSVCFTEYIFVAICRFCMCMIVICTLWLKVIHTVKLYIYLITGTFR